MFPANVRRLHQPRPAVEQVDHHHATRDLWPECGKQLLDVMQKTVVIEAWAPWKDRRSESKKSGGRRIGPAADQLMGRTSTRDRPGGQRTHRRSDHYVRP